MTYWSPADTREYSALFKRLATLACGILGHKHSGTVTYVIGFRGMGVKFSRFNSPTCLRGCGHVRG